jgi:hypothetical protein
MIRLWEEEMRAGSRVLRRETLARLGGAKQIVRTHLDQIMDKVSEGERDAASRLLDFLVTPSGTKIAHSLADLAYFAKLPPGQVQPLLTMLAAPQARVLRAVVTSGDRTERYEIFHDVLGAAILDWRTRYVQTDTEKRVALEAADREREVAWQREAKVAQKLALAERARAEEAEKHGNEQKESANKLRRPRIGGDGSSSRRFDSSHRISFHVACRE